MKKITSVILVTALLLTNLFALTSCSHECEFSSEWSVDESSHWHVCTVKEDCIECADKADHSWNEGEITTKPTRDAEGVMTYICTVCDYKREDALPKCDFSGEWLKDEASHWHVCANDGCDEIGDKADHTWNEGEITTKATQEADGVRTFTCTACKATKEEPVEFLGLEKAEWDKLFSDKALDNFTYEELACVKVPGFEMETKLYLKFTKYKTLLGLELMGNTEEEVYTGDEAAALKEEMVNSIQTSFLYDSFEYDTKQKAYILKDDCDLGDISENSDVDIDSAKVVIKADGTIELIYIGTSLTDEGVELDVLTTVTLRDFGTTKIEGSSSVNVSPL